MRGIICKLTACFSTDIVIFICVGEQLLQKYAYREYSLKDNSCVQAIFLSYSIFSTSETLPGCQIARLFLIPAHTLPLVAYQNFYFKELKFSQIIKNSTSKHVFKHDSISEIMFHYSEVKILLLFQKLSTAILSVCQM